MVAGFPAIPCYSHNPSRLLPMNSSEFESRLRKVVTLLQAQLVCAENAAARASAAAGVRRALRNFNRYLLYGEVPEELRHCDEHPVVMVVDDDPVVLAVVSDSLLGNGYTVLAAQSGGQALTLARSFAGRIDLLLSDVRIQGIDGYQLVKVLREEGLTRASLFMTGVSPNEIPGEFMSKTLLKPFQPAALQERIALELKT